MDILPTQKFDCLPNEVVHQICLYLDVESIKRFSLTCTRYANVIADSSALVKDFKLKLTKGFVDQWQSQLIGSKRKYCAIEVTDIAVDSHHSHSVLRKIFDKFGPQLRTLVISNSTLDDFTLLTILKGSPFLEELCLSEVVIEQKLPAINSPSIVHLTSVAIHHTDWLIFKFLARAQITSLLVNSYFNEGEGTRTHLVGMLSNQYRLRELTLHGTSSKTLFKGNDFNETGNFALSKFHIECGFGRNSDTVDGNIVNFLIWHNEALRNVAISMPNCEQIAIFILLNLGNLTSLTLDVGGLSKDNAFYQTLIGTEPNLELKHLKLSGFFCHFAYVKAILNKFPEVTDLELDDWSKKSAGSNTLKFVAEKFPLLEKLFIREIANDADALTFIALKQLRVSYIRNVQNLINFVRKNRSIEKLEIGLVYIEQISTIGPALSRLMDFAHIKYLSFTGSAISLRMIFDLVQTMKPQTLKTLELFIFSHENYSNVSTAMRKSIKINFPNSWTDLRSKLDAFVQ